ncbi:hypothetical protein ACFS27_29370 [Promicromonospora vindobonensis]|uniref:Uncharacterized protein n=1 Tax=Promicromonospora vindobonensis TaxID=195748 RepID=A0ABW5W2I1_9MICO
MSHETPNSDNDFLRGALHGAADTMPGAEVDDLHVSFGVVRDRVRRRRAAKIGGLTGASLALVGVLAFGATQAPLLDRAEPVPPGTSESATPDAAPTATPGPDLSLREDFTPDWLAGTGLSCGMPVSDLEERATASEYHLEVRGDLHQIAETLGEPHWRYDSVLPVSLTWDAVQGVDSSPAVPPVLVWSRDGQVVDLGGDRTDAEPVPVEPEGRYSGATDLPGSSCVVEQTPLPDGEYDVRALTRVHPVGGEDPSLAVSDPVVLTVENGAVHQNPGSGEAAPFEVPESADEPSASSPSLGSAVVDRTGPWGRDVTYSTAYDEGGDWRWYPDDGQRFTVEARCTSADPSDEITLRTAGWLVGAGGGESTLPCDGETVSLPALTASSTAIEQLEEQGAVRSAYFPVAFTEVPDGVTLAYADVEPEADGGDAAGECSASSLDLEYDPANSPSEGAGSTAAAIVEAALACDSERLTQLATEHGTELMLGNATPEDTFRLPEDAGVPYETLVRLLAGTSGEVNGGDPGNETITWPRVAVEEFADSNEAWAEAVEAGLLTQADADAQRADEFGYVGMRIGIAEDGTWRYYSGGD